MKYLVCINTTKKLEYTSARQGLREQDWFIALQSNPDVEIVEVYADLSVTESVLENGVLTVPAPDRYDHLVTKVFRMFEFFAQRGGFDYIVKVDDSIVRTKQSRALSTKGIAAFCSGDYSGITLFMSLPFTHSAWAKSHGLSSVRNIPLWVPYFSGKCYACSKEACDAVVSNGSPYLETFIDSYLGVEDFFIGYVLDKHFFSRTQRAIFRVRGIWSSFTCALQTRLARLHS